MKFNKRNKKIMIGITIFYLIIGLIFLFLNYKEIITKNILFSYPIIAFIIMYIIAILLGEHNTLRNKRGNKE